MRQIPFAMNDQRLARLQVSSLEPTILSRFLALNAAPSQAFNGEPPSESIKRHRTFLRIHKEKLSLSPRIQPVDSVEHACRLSSSIPRVLGKPEDEPDG